VNETSADRFGDDFGGERMWGLKELPYPDPVAFTPETVGWLVLGIGLALLLAWSLWRCYRRRQANAYRREAMIRLAGLESSQAAELPFVLRKVALVTAGRGGANGRAAVASLRGDAWIRWLNETAGTRLFDEADAHTLDRMAYSEAPPEATEFERLKSASRHWVRVHHA
jgi:hypothetical protein